MRTEAVMNLPVPIRDRTVARCGVTSFSAIRTVAAREFGDRFRSGWVIASAAVWLGAICLASFFGLVQIGQLGVQGYERTVVSLLNLVQYLVPLLGLLLGHDLLVAEREDRTITLVLSTGISRAALLCGKFLGGVLAISFPLVLGFLISGVVIGMSGGIEGMIAFIKLAISALVLGVVFVAAGLAISALLRTRVQALVAALLVWCFAIFVFDLAALGLLLATRAPAAAQEIELACDPTHVNAATTDIHGAFNDPGEESSPRETASAISFSWVLLNPVDLFRAINLAPQLGLRIPPPLVITSTLIWLGGLLWLALWRFRTQDL